ncbi:hypothetical protein BpHYR1_040109 [Brachionus plicatilis]|uniref:Uncharacterized protein n=1 Tax=Brachionus plicatilis TaxID=10195 RepID=A0A3M7P4X9_BRAPC|nr:hypothetical protein BpHYR1_040109 [Brachionus plicatilis]
MNKIINTRFLLRIRIASLLVLVLVLDKQKLKKCSKSNSLAFKLLFALQLDNLILKSLQPPLIHKLHQKRLLNGVFQCLNKHKSYH